MAHYVHLHDWPTGPVERLSTEAVLLQNRLRDQVRIEPLTKTPQTIAGCDISFNKFEETVYAGIVVLRLDTLETIEEAGVVSTAPFPYIPGLLSFREIPSLLEAWQKAKNRTRCGDVRRPRHGPPAPDWHCLARGPVPQPADVWLRQVGTSG